MTIRPGGAEISELAREGTSGEAREPDRALVPPSSTGADSAAELARGIGYVNELVEPLVVARSPRECARAVAKVATGLAAVRAAAWISDEEQGAMTLVVALGLGPGERARLEDRWSHLPRWLGLSSRARAGAAREVAGALGVEHVAAELVGPVLLLIGGARGTAERVGASVGPLLRAKLEQARSVATAQARNDRLDLSLAWTAHELVAPLIAARVALEEVRARPSERPSDAGEVLAEVERALDELVGTCEELLRWAVGAPTRGVEPEDLGDVVRDAVRSCRLLAGGRGVAVAAPPGVVVRADRTQLRVAVENLVRNALSYSPPGGEVLVTLERRDGVATITVADEGPGIPEGERDGIFDPFIRGVGTLPARGGRGLGLFIARRVADAHEGSLWVEPGESGAAFKLELPLAGEVVGSYAS